MKKEFTGYTEPDTVLLSYITRQLKRLPDAKHVSTFKYALETYSFTVYFNQAKAGPIEESRIAKVIEEYAQGYRFNLVTKLGSQGGGISSLGPNAINVRIINTGQ